MIIRARINGKIRRRLERLYSPSLRAEYHVDTYFGKDGSLAMRHEKDNSFLACGSLRYPVEDPTKLGEILEKSLGIFATVRKLRITYVLNDEATHIRSFVSVDNVFGLGMFVKIKVMDHSHQAQIIANYIMVQLGIEEDHILKGCYVDFISGTKLSFPMQ